MTTFFFQPGDIQETTCEWISWTSAECSLFKKKKKKCPLCCVLFVTLAIEWWNVKISCTVYEVKDVH